MKGKKVKQVFTRPTINLAETKVVHVVCKKAGCSGGSTHISVNKLEELVKKNVA